MGKVWLLPYFGMRKDFNVEISTVQGALQTIHALNCGGCGIVAVALKRWVNREFPEKETQIVYLLNDWDIKHNKSNLVNNNAGSCMHVMLVIDGKYYDSETNGVDFHDTNYYFKTEEVLEVTEDVALKSAQDYSIWNRWFDREYGVPAIANACALGDAFETEILKELEDAS